LTVNEVQEKKEDVDRKSDEIAGSRTPSENGYIAKIAGWFDSRLGLSYPFLREAPAYSINPFYWLGALTVVAFVIQGVTGVMLMLYYIPSPAQAYSSTLFIFQSVSYGRFLETVHLYTAYAMIVLAFMHMMRGYFVSVYKAPREAMWVIGMIMGFVTLGFGFTGYLLPWTVVSKSATDVGVGMISALPQPFSSFFTFLLVGASGDAGVLLRFYDLHVVILPAVLLLLLALKMYMLEAHGISPPPAGVESLPEKKRKLIPIFPDVTFYLVELAALFGSAMLLISAIFPLNLPPEYTPQLAAQYTSQPDWYFLWIYQILKIDVFEGKNLPVALTIVTLILIALVVLPVLDRGKERRISKRMKFVTLGAVFVAEITVLSVWGELTPGQVISNEQAALVLGGTALIITLASVGAYKLLSPVLVGRKSAPTPLVSAGKTSALLSKSAALWTAASFVGVLALATFSISNSINAVVDMVIAGVSLQLVESLGLALAGLSISVFAIGYLIYRLELSSGHLKRRIRLFEIGWKNE
jgi:quinol-cytochrome oxidoreductase complex cytochrome b subunit